MDLSGVAPKTDPLRHAEDARRRARLALYTGERHHLPGGGYFPEISGGLARGAIAGGIVLAAAIPLGLPAPQVLALFSGAAVALALAEGLLAARASAAQIGFYRAEIAREAREIAEDPEGERRELLALYEAKGLRGNLLEDAVDRICSDPETLLKVMLEEELGIFATRFEHPALQGLLDGIATVAGALPAGVAFALVHGGEEVGSISPTVMVAWIASAVVFGAVRARITREPALQAGGIAAGIALAGGGLAYLVARLTILLLIG